MTKQELIDVIAAKAQDIHGAIITKKLVESVFLITCTAIVKEVTTGGNVMLPGIGTLRAKAVSERIGTNPRTQQKIQIPAHFSLKVSVSEAMKAALATCPMPNYSATPAGKQRKGA